MTDNVSKHERSRVMACVKSKDTTPEKRLADILHELKIRFGKQAKDLPGTPDFVFRKLKKVVWVHGCFWHGHTCGRCRIPAQNRAYWIEKIRRNAARDRKNRKLARERGFGTMIVWECQLKKANLVALKKRIARFLEH